MGEEFQGCSTGRRVISNKGFTCLAPKVTFSRVQYSAVALRSAVPVLRGMIEELLR